MDPRAPDLEGTGFAEGGSYGTAEGALLDKDIKTFGSWMGSDLNTGKVRSRVYLAPNSFYLGVDGYPGDTNRSLAVELTCRGDRHRTVPVEQRTVLGETWRVQRIRVGSEEAPCQVVIVGEDLAQGREGWVGFSEPFSLRTDPWEQVGELFRLVTCVCLVTAVLLGPGLVLRSRFAGSRTLFGLLPVPGIGLLCLSGLLIWITPAALPARVVAAISLGALLTALAGQLWRRSEDLLAWTPAEGRVLLAFASLTLICVAKASYSEGPEGELFSATTGRTLEVGDRSDARIPYLVAELVGKRESPTGAFSHELFWPWAFSDRGPLPGLAASPIMLVSFTTLPFVLPEQPWQPFDPEGCAAFRICLMLMSVAVVFSVYALTSSLGGERAAGHCMALLILMPFFVHELYFTWPKILAAAGVLWAAQCVLARRFVVAGLFVGIAYLFHPLALFSLLPLVVLAVMSKEGEWRRTLAIVLGLGAVLVAWRLVNWGNFHQGKFLDYILETNDRPSASLGAWIEGRFVSLASTLVPFYGLAFHAHDVAVNAYRATSPTIVRFFFQYWTNLPFGVGLISVPLLVRWLARGAARRWKAFVWLLLLPFVSFWIYWGSFWSGMMREGLHAWFLSVLIWAALSRWSGPAESLGLGGRALIAFVTARAFELLSMMLVPTLATAPEWINARFAVSDLTCLLAMLAGVSGLVGLAVGWMRTPRQSTSEGSEIPLGAGIVPAQGCTRAAWGFRSGERVAVPCPGSQSWVRAGALTSRGYLRAAGTADPDRAGKAHEWLDALAVANPSRG